MKTECRVCNNEEKDKDPNEFHPPHWCVITQPSWRAAPEEWEKPFVKLIVQHNKENYIDIRCAGIGCLHTKKISLNIKWHGISDVDNNIYCHDCYKQKQWFDSVCGGCVAGFPDCPFGKTFMYRYGKRELTKEEKKTILFGKCPFRVNGTFMMNRSVNEVKIKTIDISNKALYQEGLSILKGMKRYKELYKVDKP